MKIKVFAGTNLGYVPPKEELDKIGGLTAGVCYLPNTIETLFSESEEKTKRREGMIKSSGHRSPFDHAVINLEIDDVPKIVAMILNDEQMYTTSEKSARYKRMELSADEKELYEKWLEIFKTEITKLKPSAPNWFSDTKITKLAQENARYLTSVFTPTSMAYTISYRQLNIIYRKIEKEIGFLKNQNDAFSVRLKTELEAFNDQLKSLNYIDANLSEDDKNYALKLFYRKDRTIKEQFGECYTVVYNGSLAQLAQAQRHRTLNYEIDMNKQNLGFYVPAIIKGKSLEALWLADCKKMENFPQATLVSVVERGTYENLLLKAKERCCTSAQLEINKQTAETLTKFYNETKNDNPELAEEVKPYINGSRCMFGGKAKYNCPTPCGYKDGVTGERII